MLTIAGNSFVMGVSATAGILVTVLAVNYILNKFGKDNKED